MGIDIYYWISEYGKVFCGYLFLMFLWPSVVFHGYLREKSKTFRFSFCVTVPIVIMNTLVLGLGLVHGLSQWVVQIFFYGIFAAAFLKNVIAFLNRKYKRMMKAEFPDIRSLRGKYRKLVLVILFFIVCGRYVKRVLRFLSFDYFKRIKACNWPKVRLRIKESIWRFGRKLGSLFWRYGFLALVIVYGMVYFSYGATQVYSYGYGDLYTHHKWIYGLIEGNIFVDGIYPEAMHCFIYCMHTLFDIKVYSILLYLQIIHVAIFFLSFYILLRKVFSWRYTPLFVLMLFLTLDLSNADSIHSMFRLQITLPMEFGLHTVCLCTYFWINYLYREYNGGVDKNGKMIKSFCNENLFLFMMSLTAAITIHFHVVLMVLFICVSFSIFALKRIFNRANLISLILALLCTVVIAGVPMAGALAQGIPFNSSINWALGTMNGSESRALREKINDAVREENITEAPDEELQDINRSEISITATVFNGIAEIYDKGYASLYGKGRGGWLLLLTVVLAVFCCLVKWKKKFRFFRDICFYYPFVIVASVIYVFVYAAPMIGLPDIIPEGRFFSIGNMMMMAVVAMPVDVLLSGLAFWGRDFTLRILSLLLSVGIYGLSIVTGNFRGLLFYELSRYNAASNVTESIINSFPMYSYTIVSPTDELYPVIQYGWHEELLSFVENCNNGEYTIPSEYVFIYVEKKPLLYAQSLFFEGPMWMGEQKYLEPFWEMYSLKYPNNGASQSPNLITSQVSKEGAEREILEYENAWTMYLDPDSRMIIESKIYEWCEKFAQKYPSVMNIYYEDDAFVCYYFRQDMGSDMYKLAIE